MPQLALSNSHLPVIGSDTGLRAYFAAIKKFPLLTKDEEYRLAKQFTEHDDVEAAHKLVTSHLRLVAKVAWANRFYGIPVADLISEGTIGLMRAVKGFQPDRGFRLATYALWWIKAAINECVLGSWSLVKIGSDAARKRLFFNLRKVKAKIGVYEGGDIPRHQAEAIARQLNVKTDDVIDMNQRLSHPDTSLNQIVGETGELERQDFLVDPKPSQEECLAEKEERLLRLRRLEAALGTLTPRERRVIEERRLTDNPRSLDEIGRQFGVSRERIRQIEARAMEKLQSALKKKPIPFPANAA